MNMMSLDQQLCTESVFSVRVCVCVREREVLVSIAHDTCMMAVMSSYMYLAS